MLRFQVVTPRGRQDFDHPGGPIEFGRGPSRQGVPRCVLQDEYVSRDHVQVVDLGDGRVRITNLSGRNTVRLPDCAVPPGGCHEAATPLQMGIGETLISVASAEADAIRATLQSVVLPPAAPGLLARPRLGSLGQSPAPETLTYWLETVIAVQRAAAGSPEFYDQTARAVVELVGLERALVLLLRQGQWVVQARYPDMGGAGERGGREFSLTVLEHMAHEGRTVYQSAGSSLSATASLAGVEAVVASPVLDSANRVVGAIYGSRAQVMALGAPGIGALEAQVIQMLACTVGIGLARIEQEAEAARLRVQFEQFFSADLARELQKNPRLLEGQEREVTVLFADVRGFSRLAERLGPAEICRLIAEVMEHLTGSVYNTDGVVVDYAGDGLLAAWNAPGEQPDHADRACRAALAMLADLPRLNAAWEARLGAPLRLGVGINTGPALVGNVGSRRKFKYGPLGHTVNLASRVEGATKHLGIPLLITGSTRARIADTFATRRLCKVRLAGIQNPVDLYELGGETVPDEWRVRRDTYEQALARYEAGDWAGACTTLLPVLIEPSGRDGPGLNLMARAIDALRSPPEDFDGLFAFAGK